MKEGNLFVLKYIKGYILVYKALWEASEFRSVGFLFSFTANTHRKCLSYILI